MSNLFSNSWVKFSGLLVTIPQNNPRFLISIIKASISGKVTECLAVKPKSCLFIGDDKNDMIAGKNAGIKTVAVAYGYGKVEQDWGYDFLVNTVKELEKWIL
jgi:phosphoglycolate phosphatase-like HAD superfamily hydrolase